jgi:hypothetical protein
MDSMVTHADTEFGPHVDMRSADPQYRLDDPGVGLRILHDPFQPLLFASYSLKYDSFLYDPCPSLAETYS